MLRVLGAARKRDVKATQNLSVIVLFFMICWIPLYTINCIQAFCPSCFIHPKLTLFCIILSHLNSAVNPVLYAYHLTDFRLALKNLILKIMGVDFEQTLESQHRYSLASQYRLQTMDVSARNSMQARIYIDSPIWLRQQKQQTPKHSQLMIKRDTITSCFINIHQTATAVASIADNNGRNIWNMKEAPRGSELGKVDYIFTNDKNSTAHAPPPIVSCNHKSQTTAYCRNPLFYDKCTYTPNPNNDFSCHKGKEADHKVLNKSLEPLTVHDKWGSDVDARLNSPNLQNYHEILDKRDSRLYIPKRHFKIHDNIPPLTPNQFRQLQPKENHKQTQIIHLNNCLNNTSNDVIYTEFNKLKPRHKPKFQKSAQTATLKSLKRCPSLSSDTSASTSPQRDIKSSIHYAHTISSDSLCASMTSLNQNFSLVSDQLPYSQNNNVLNYYTFHYPPSHFHRNQRDHKKLSRIKTMTSFIIPPSVKHSSLFQLFHPSSSPTYQTDSNSTIKLRTTTSLQNKSQGTIDAAESISTY